VAVLAHGKMSERARFFVRSLATSGIRAAFPVGPKLIRRGKRLPATDRDLLALRPCDLAGAQSSSSCLPGLERLGFRGEAGRQMWSTARLDREEDACRIRV
jgi:hypothetical protein